MGEELEQCRSGGWKMKVDFEEAREKVKDILEPEVDSDHLLVFHVGEVKCSLVESSGVLRVRTGDRERASRIAERLL
ncbi:MAG: hypothetical protein MUP63_02480 [Candidatus Nanohaloarchaeota archaeon QJJ-7]|nr:hypothetical protein [Candidatus Nanohaloarchaeota archaeon QJJ-7]